MISLSPIMKMSSLAIDGGVYYQLLSMPSLFCRCTISLQADL